MLENPSADIRFTDGSCSKDYAGKTDRQIRAYINSLLDQSSVTVCLISARTRFSEWVRWELDSSSSKRKGIIGIVLKGKNAEIPTVRECPGKFATGRYRVIYWNTPAAMAKEVEEAERRR